MGNPKIQQAAPPQPERPPAANGILANVGGAFIAAGMNQLPMPKATEQPVISVGVDVPDLGLVRITYRLDWYSHGRGKFWHWRAVHAERVSGK